MSKADLHDIVAIGASSGSMEEIKPFSPYAIYGVSYIIIQDLSSDFKSKMVELLTRHSKLVVEEARNGTTVKGKQEGFNGNQK